MKEKIEYLKKFAEKHGLTLELDGEVGFGRKCVGLIDKRGTAYLDYNPYQMTGDFEQIEKYYSDGFYEITPPNAYHKHDCFAVLGEGNSAISELYDWIVALENLGEVSIQKYETGASGIQAMVSGTHGYCVMVTK